MLSWVIGGLLILKAEKITLATTASASASGRSASGNCSTHGLPRPMKTLPMSFERSGMSRPFSLSHIS